MSDYNGREEPWSVRRLHTVVTLPNVDLGSLKDSPGLRRAKEGCPGETMRGGHERRTQPHDIFSNDNRGVVTMMVVAGS